MKSLLILMILAIAFSACNKDKTDEPVKSMDELKIAPNFDYSMVSAASIRIATKDLQGNALGGVRLEVYREFDEITSEGTLLLTGVTNQQGVFEVDYPLDKATKKLYVLSRYIGLPALTEVNVSNGIVNAVIGGMPPGLTTKESFFNSELAANYQLLCPHNSTGVPSCLIFPRDVISADFLADVNAALPERAPVPQFNPHYLASGNQTDLRLTEPADVWVTFVHEGAGFRNTIGFYTYNLNSPPTSASQIQTIYIAFPNYSLVNSGGNMRSGDKVKLGTFPAGTGIGWVLIADGFNISTGSVVTTRQHFYSNPAFNPEANPTLRQHNVLLFDPVRKRFLIGFEDIRRDSQSCDNDFNDAIFYVTSNPITAVQYTNMPLVNPNLIDTDGDTVPDVMDDYPNDPTKAFNNYYPGRNMKGGLAFEDLWPQKGDYDFNDMVLSYYINQITNAQNRVVEIQGTFTVEAIGAGFKNGFGIQLGVPPSAIQSVTGANLRENIINLAANGTETGQSKAVIFPFDNTYNLFMPAITSGFVNTKPGMPYVQPRSVNLTIKFNTPQLPANITLPPYNPFIIINKQRGREVHLPGYPPTDKVDVTLFRTGDDDTNPATGKYYKSKINLPWAMHLPAQFAYPLETEPIIGAHLKFANWAQSSGSEYVDWYTDKVGYRNNAKIYQRSSKE